MTKAPLTFLKRKQRSKTNKLRIKQLFSGLQTIISHFYRKRKARDHQKIREFCWRSVVQDPTKPLQSYVRELNEAGYACNKKFVRKIFVDWKWNWKRPSLVQLLKYTPTNIKRYKDYVEWIRPQDLSKLKFVDMVHYMSQSQPRSKALLMENVVLFPNEEFPETYSISCLCALDRDHPIFLSAKTEYFPDTDFLFFIADAISKKHLKEGDTLVCEESIITLSAPVTVETLTLLLHLFEIELVLLPLFSPEFNPLKRVFSQSKAYLRENRNPNNSLIDDIAISFGFISFQNILGFFKKCCT